MLIYSKRLGNISKIQFQKALDRFNLGKFIKAEKIPFGNFGQNVFVSSDKGEFVLRGAPHFPHQFESEKFIIDLLHKKTKTPVPFPYNCDETPDIFGWKYVIMPKMPGIQLIDPEVQKRLSQVERVKIATAAALNLVEMHRLTWDCSGEYDPKTKTIKPFQNSFYSVVFDRTKTFVNKCISYNAKTTQKDKDWVLSLLEKAKKWIDSPFTPAVIMQDYRPGNMVARKVGDRWEISGVFDLQEWYFGDSEVDLCRTAAVYIEKGNHECLKEFINKYINNKQIRLGFRERLSAYMLLDRMIVWDWAQRNKNIWWDKRLNLRGWAEPFVNEALKAIREKNKSTQRNAALSLNN